jgi:hypothetical protein
MVFIEAWTENDFMYINLVPSPECPTHEKPFDPDSCVFDPDIAHRWGMYEDEDQFAVYDKEEVERLGQVIGHALQGRVEGS